MDKKRIAKEWIVFLISALAGIAIIPIGIYLIAGILGKINYEPTIGEIYYELLFKKNGILVFPIGFYLFILLVRSIIWSIKTTGDK